MKKTQLKKIVSILLVTLMLATMFSCLAGAAGSDSISINGIGVYEIFNSGRTTSIPDSDNKTYADTLTNNGQDIFVDYEEETQIGISFTIDAVITSDVILSMYHYDVDEESGERDKIYLVDETDGSKDLIGVFSGMNEQWNTTSMVIDAELLEVGHKYHIYLHESVWGWYVWVRTVTLDLGNAFEIDASMDLAVDNDQAIIKSDVTISTSIGMNYDLEFKAVNVEDGNQYGSAFDSVNTLPTLYGAGYNIYLNSDAPAGEYTVYLYIKNPSTGAVILVLEDNVFYQDHEHNLYSAIDYEPTCVADGKISTYCDICGEHFGSESIPALGHDVVGISFAPTCTETGENKVYCNRCGEVFEHTILAPYGHNPVDTVYPASCTTDGKIVTSCDVCGEILKTVIIPAYGHSVVETETSATCTEDGEYVCYCETCGEVFEEYTISAYGHDYEETDYEEPTVYDDGYYEYTCMNCGDVYYEYIPRHVHNYETFKSNATCTKDGIIIISCDDCGEIFNETVLPATGHNYKETARKDAEPGVEGYVQYTCSKCGATYREKINALENRNFFQKIWDLIVKFFVFIGLS